MKENIIDIYQRSFVENAELPALTDYGRNNTITYFEFAERIARMHEVFRELGIEKGDKIALIGKNTSNWVTVFISTITYGATIVPILQEFNPLDVQHIVNHSEAKILFATKAIWDTIEFDALLNIIAVISIDSDEVFAEKEGEKVSQVMASADALFKKAYPAGFTKEDIKYDHVDDDSVVILNYTSGTTGYSKGVMITCANITGNAVYGIASRLHYRGTSNLSFLPLAHAYGCAFDLLVPLCVGTHVNLLGRIPSPKILVKAMQEVKPHLVVSVPLVLEKVYRKQIVPLISKGMMRWALNIPFLDTKIYDQIRKKLIDAFGGEFEELIIGGAPLNPEVEDFLMKINFPFTVGYGMTECAPLISGTPPKYFVAKSGGCPVLNMEVRIDNPNEEGIGEILVKGENVMVGYYKNEEATRAAFTEDGWMRTGDLGYLDKKKNVFIKGRNKTMILGASGQNIDPEEIEDKLNNLEGVGESIVVEREGKLIGLVFPDEQTTNKFSIEEIENMMRENLAKLNKLIPGYSRVSDIEIKDEPFEKTPKKSIKRFLYK